MRIIQGGELRTRLRSGERPWLVHEQTCADFRAHHLPGAITFSDLEQLVRVLRTSDLIVAYGYDESCLAARDLVVELALRGYPNAYWYSGGIREWARSGAALEGDATG
jgi:rhodanese-related sulfurtransferase